MSSSLIEIVQTVSPIYNNLAKEEAETIFYKDLIHHFYLIYRNNYINIAR